MSGFICFRISYCPVFSSAFFYVFTIKRIGLVVVVYFIHNSIVICGYNSPFPFGDFAGGEGGADGDEALVGAAFETQSELLVLDLERAVDYYVEVVEQGA